jgi:DNA-binding NarL/FixJ family response regulator
MSQGWRSSRESGKAMSSGGEHTFRRAYEHQVVVTPPIVAGPNSHYLSDVSIAVLARADSSYPAASVAAGSLIRILFSQVRQLVADGLEALLNQQPDMVVVGNIGSMPDSAMYAAELDPDIVIMDFGLGAGTCNDAAIALRRTGCDAKVIVLTGDQGDNVLLAAIEVGASAVVSESWAAPDVINAIRDVARGLTLIRPRTLATLLNNRRMRNELRDGLTHREREILGMLVRGTPSREIATRLGISYTTVRTHLRNLATKLAAHSKLEVVAKAHELDLVGVMATPPISVL